MKDVNKKKKIGYISLMENSGSNKGIMSACYCNCGCACYVVN
jgi:hypothetical protein